VTDSHQDIDARLATLHARRWRIAVALTAAMVANYFGFVALVAYRKNVLATLIVPGLSLGILLGALVIVLSWILTWVYVRWANQHYDVALERVRESAS
jgi:uncharacterized membrane protein (DUF485 family)